MKAFFSGAVAVVLAAAPALALDPSGLRLPEQREGTSVAPLPEELFTQEEAAYYNTRLANASAEVKLRFRYTRSYLRYCRRAVDGSVPADRRISAIELPDLPDERKWDRAFLFGNEARDFVDVALGRKMVAQMRGERPTGSIPV